MEYDEKDLPPVDIEPESHLDQSEPLEIPDDAAFVALADDPTFAPPADVANEQPPAFTMSSAADEGDLPEMPTEFDALSSTELDDVELPPLPDDLLDLPDIMAMDEPPLPAYFAAKRLAGDDAVNTPDLDLDPLRFDVSSESRFQIDIQSSVGIDEQYVAKSPSFSGGSLLESVVADIDRHQTFIPMTDLPSVATGPFADEEEVTEQHVIFMLDGTAYSLPISHITEIGRPLPITSLPNVPSWVLGVSNLRGDIVSVVDLRAFMGKQPLASTRDCRMMVVRSRREDITTALLVDHVREIRHLSSEQVTLPTAPIEDQSAVYMRGVYEHGGRLLVLLDPEQLMLSPEMRQFESRNNAI